MKLEVGQVWADGPWTREIIGISNGTVRYRVSDDGGEWDLSLVAFRHGIDVDGWTLGVAAVAACSLSEAMAAMACALWPWCSDIISSSADLGRGHRLPSSGLKAEWRQQLRTWTIKAKLRELDEQRARANATPWSPL